MFQCSRHIDVATTITLAKNNVNEYHQLQKLLKSLSPTSDQQKLQEISLKSQSLLNDARILLEQIDIMKTNIKEGIEVYIEVLELQGNNDLAVEILEKLVRENPENGSYWVRLGINNMKKGKEWLKPAFHCFEKAVKLKLSDKEKRELWRALGDIYWELRQIEPARESYNKTLSAGDDIWSKVGLAGLDVVDGNMKKAEDSLVSIGKELREYDIPVRLRMREALSLFEELKKDLDETPEMVMAYSHLLYRAGRVEDAIATAQHALSMNNQDWEGWNFLGSIYLQLGYVKDAERVFSESIKINPEQPNIKRIVEEISKAEKTPPSKGKDSQPLIFRKD